MTLARASRLTFRLTALLAAAAIAGCGGAPRRGEVQRLPDAGVPAPPARGGYYLDDGPGDNPPPDLASVPDAEPRIEPVRAANTRPYEALGRTYTPMSQLGPYRERGIASWYGRRYHGRPTASGEIYDMYAMTAAHPILPIPSYARVTNLRNGRSVVVRINDRGPFHAGRVIDLSYTAAYKLDVLAGGSTLVEVESIVPGEEPPAARIAAAPAPPAAMPLPAEPRPGADPGGAAEAPPAPAAATAAAPGYYVQFGAFGSRDNAQSYLLRLKTRLDWLADSLHLSDAGGLFRVSAGPYPDPSAARQVADRIAQLLDFKPLVTAR